MRAQFVLFLSVFLIKIVLWCYYLGKSLINRAKKFVCELSSFILGLILHVYAECGHLQKSLKV
ncbi:hypothetical protein TSAR_007139 [Trichomalopsis sarcophagae]|uniref:Uncharacterized protein n=1 Tax=Trichomalopsis sarcophagae TaxID=543379 RepID=A0A232EPB8_9HYME|nr:hypothetical protein TSAR_007139 [Trichomalopsis sarcophagae]